MRASTWIPSKSGLEAIRSFTLVECDAASEHPILPDTDITLAFRIAGRVDIDDGRGMATIEGAVVSGLRAVPRRVRYHPGGACLVVRFLPGTVPGFLDRPAHVLNGVCEPLGEMRSRSLETLRRDLADASGDQERFRILETCFATEGLRTRPRPEIATALRTLQERAGTVPIRDLARDVCMSLDHFEKEFRASVGATPKRFARILRMRKALELGRRGIPLDEIPYRTGHYDQAHFIGEFKAFTGKTPKVYFATELRW